MPERRWTIMIVPQGSSASRVLEISQTALKLVASLVIALTVVALLLGYATVSRTVDVARAESLEIENERLAQTLGQLQGRLSTLADTLQELEQRDSRLRVMANLDPIDPQVRAAGIGGPSRTYAEPSSVLLGQAGSVRVDVNALMRRATLLSASFSEAADSLATHADRLASMPSIMPTQGWLSSNYSTMRSHPLLRQARPHEGIDVVAPRGTPIIAPGAGTVVSSRFEAGYGNTVVLDHGHGIITRYAHASRLLVTPGQRVERGARIALVGNSGLSTSPHLHYEVHVNGRPVNPLRYILPAVITD
ncbi:MAG TPA: peptidoglycan DD-metalloendopeptidase family protein [Gemmatimonadales bacterium]|nr:peptidoglycan DD-metalloendopeptidase family protein [Gemmatimonadales bacterium]